VNEHGAAAAGDARAAVVVDLDEEVVKPIVAPEPVASVIGRPPEWPVISAVSGIFAPSQIGCDTSDCE
jgi:hypothetical protein